MTFKEFVIKYLFDNGMFQDQAQQVFDAMSKDESNAAMDRWDDDIEDYPEQMRAVVILLARQAAVKWIDANLPMAWYRPMFADDIPHSAIHP
jgi:hypothetical protein